MYKRRIILYGHSEWSMGRLFTDLVKSLYTCGYDAMLLPWEVSYNYEELIDIVSVADFIVSTPQGLEVLHNATKFPYEKAIVALFHTTDVNYLRSTQHLDYRQVYRIAAAGQWIKDQCTDLGVPIHLIKNGINTNAYSFNLPSELNVIGFGAAYHSREEIQIYKDRGVVDEPKLFKRGYLVKELADKLNLQIKIPHPTYKSYRTLPGFYSKIDCVICASTDEGAGGPVLEGAAAGRLVITTDAGDFRNMITPAGADPVPVDESLFLEECERLLLYYKQNNRALLERCYSIREYARKHLDWNHCIPSWTNLFTD